MKFADTSVEGAFVIEATAHADARGSFRRLWCKRQGEINGHSLDFVQSSISFSPRRGTLRGLHFQLPPSREGKLVSCVQGRIHDVALDLRPRSRSYLSHTAVVLAGNEPRAFFIPAGCAHGFLTLTDECSVLYMMTDFYDPALSTGVRWDDPRFAIVWPEAPTEMHERDAAYPEFDPRTVERFADYGTSN